MPLTITCSHCGTAFTAARRSARYCSGNCRVKAFHRRAVTGDPATLAQRLGRISSVAPLVGSKGTSSGPALMALIQAHIDQHGLKPDRWVEPFLGSGGAYLSAIRAGLATPAAAVLNDANGWAIATLRVLAERPDELLALVARTPITTAPFSTTPGPDWDDLQVACWWLQRCHTGFVGYHRQNRLSIDHSRQNYRARAWLALPARLRTLSECFRGPYLETQDAIALLQRVCTGKRADLLFVDPPYVGRERAYAVEWPAERHAELAALLQTLPATVVAVTYQDAPLVQQLYPPDRWHWHRIDRPVSTARVEPGATRARAEELLLIRRR